MEPKSNALVTIAYVLPGADGCYVILGQGDFSDTSAVSQRTSRAKLEIPILKPILAYILSQIIPIYREDMQKESGFHITNPTTFLNVYQRVRIFTEVHIENIAEQRFSARYRIILN